MLKPFVELNLADQDLNRVQNNISNAVNPITIVPFLDGQAIEGIVLTSATPVTVNHKLRREVKQIWVTKLETNAVVWTTPSDDPANTIIMNTTADATVNVWVA